MVVQAGLGEEAAIAHKEAGAGDATSEIKAVAPFGRIAATELGRWQGMPLTLCVARPLIAILRFTGKPAIGIEEVLKEGMQVRRLLVRLG